MAMAAMDTNHLLVLPTSYHPGSVGLVYLNAFRRFTKIYHIYLYIIISLDAIIKK